MTRVSVLAAPRAIAEALRTGTRLPDIQLGAYAGPSWTQPADVYVRQPGGTDLTLKDVPWLGEPFRPPPYYGYRATLWWPGRESIGLMVDFTHIKAKAMREREVERAGTLDGAALPTRGRIDALFERLEFTHGYNLLTLNALYRPRPGARVQPYAGVGAGIAVPHVELQRAGAPRATRTYEYQITGPAFQALAGVQWRVANRVSLFAEYKLSCSLNTGRLTGGGTLRVDLCSHQFLAGPALHARARPAAGP